MVPCLAITETSTTILLARVTGAMLMSELLDFSRVGLGDTIHIERGERSRATVVLNSGYRG